MVTAPTRTTATLWGTTRWIAWVTSTSTACGTTASAITVTHISRWTAWDTSIQTHWVTYHMIQSRTAVHKAAHTVAVTVVMVVTAAATNFNGF